MKKLLVNLFVMLCAVSVSAQQEYSEDWVDYILFDDGTAAVAKIEYHYSSIYNNNLDIEIPSVINGFYAVTAFGTGLPVFSVDWHEYSAETENWYEDDWYLENCSSRLESVKLPESITKIGKWAFAGCNKLTSICIPTTVNFVDSCAFSGCNRIEKVHTPDVYKWKEINFASVTANPLYYAHQLYENEEKVTELKHQFQTINDIGDYAFCGWDGTTVELWPGIKKIGICAFSDCANLESFSVYSWHADSIGSFCFSRCSNLKRVELPQVVKKIGRGAFESCKSLKNIEIPSSVNQIGAGAFWLCDSLEEVAIPQTIKIIDALTFGYCNFKSISIPNGIEELGACAFQRCDSLSTIYIPGTVAVIKQSALDCNLKSVYFEDSGSELAYAVDDYWRPFGGDLLFGNDSPVEEIYFGRNIAPTLQPSMRYLSKLNTLVFGDSVTHVSAEMFAENAALEQITFGKNITDIGSKAFAAAKNVNKIKVEAEVPPVVADNAFHPDIYATAEVLIPESSINLYQNAPVWKEFASIKKADEIVNLDETKMPTRIEVVDGAIVVKGVEAVRVYIASGKQVYSGTPGRIELPTGIYLVATDDVTKKVKI